MAFVNARRPAAAVMALAVLAALAALSIAWLTFGREGANETLHARGARLFDGTEPLAGTLSGHAEPLPPRTTRCVQCHAGPMAPPGGSAGLGPVLDGANLRAVRSRRGGPPVAYDLATFCRALRTGTDPAHIVLPSAMPRFAIDDAACDALWRYLTQASAP